MMLVLLQIRTRDRITGCAPWLGRLREPAEPSFDRPQDDMPATNAPGGWQRSWMSPDASQVPASSMFRLIYV